MTRVIERKIFMTVKVNSNRCPQNHPCPALRVCPVNALTQDGYGAPKIDLDKCIGCKKCIGFCPMGALQVAAG
jgi:Fe-S-cluster-containing hydrogenase component 2